MNENDRIVGSCHRTAKSMYFLAVEGALEMIAEGALLSVSDGNNDNYNDNDKDNDNDWLEAS